MTDITSKFTALSIWVVASAIALAPHLSAADTGSEDDDAAEDASTFFVGAGGDVWVEGADGVNGGHGHALVHWRWDGFPGPGRLDTSLETDTLRVRLSNVELGDRTRLSASLKGQYPYAALLPDYYRLGSRRPAREFRAGYLRARLGLEYQPADSHFANLSVQGRKWFFRRADRTGDEYQVPDDFWSVEPRLNYTVWFVEPDSSQWEPHQPFYRVRGFATGVRLGADIRSSTDPWGARGPAFDPPDPRNAPDQPLLFIRQWGRLGLPVDTPFYLAMSVYAGWGNGEDDLTRTRIGGLNPFVAPVAGLPWGVLSSGRYLTGRTAVRWTGRADHEFGVFLDHGAVADVRRVGDLQELGAVGGTGLLADLRWGPWTADVRVGWAFPFEWLADKPAVSAWLWVGRKL